MEQSDLVKLFVIQFYSSSIFRAIPHNFIEGIKRITDVSDKTFNEHTTPDEKNYLEHKSIGATQKGNHF